MGLDWKLPPYTAPTKTDVLPPPQVEVVLEVADPARLPAQCTTAPATGSGPGGYRRFDETPFGGNAWDWFLLSMSCSQMGDAQEAQQWYSALSAGGNECPRGQATL